MKYTPGLMVGQLSGKAGSTVASRNRGGSYFRTRVIPKLVRNAKTTTVRASFTGASQGWRNLTDSQRQGWSALAQSFTKKNSLGEVFHLSGINLFQSLNRNAFTIGLNPIVNPPALVEPKALDAAVGTFSAGGAETTTVIAGATSATQNVTSTAAMYVGASLAFQLAGVTAQVLAVVDPTHVILDRVVTSTTAENIDWTGLPTMSMVFDPGPVPADTRLVLSASAPLSPGVTRPSKSALRFVSVINAAATSPFDMAADYVATFGLPIAGQKIFYSIKPFSTESAIAGTAVEGSTIVS